jgi:hypothetical protein
MLFSFPSVARNSLSATERANWRCNEHAKRNTRHATLVAAIDTGGIRFDWLVAYGQSGQTRHAAAQFAHTAVPVDETMTTRNTRRVARRASPSQSVSLEQILELETIECQDFF